MKSDLRIYGSTKEIQKKLKSSFSNQPDTKQYFYILYRSYHYNIKNFKPLYDLRLWKIKCMDSDQIKF